MSDSIEAESGSTRASRFWFGVITLFTSQLQVVGLALLQKAGHLMFFFGRDRIVGRWREGNVSEEGTCHRFRLHPFHRMGLAGFWHCRL